jgi:hypothetical protein
MAKNNRVHRQIVADALTDAPAARPEVAVVAVPRWWLGGLAALLIVPWIVALGLYLGGTRPSLDRTPVAATVSAAHSESPAQRLAGPWGQLTTTPIVISPPLEYIPRDWGAPAPAAWHLPSFTPQQLETLLAALGLTREEITRLQSAARPDPRTRGLVITPDPELVRRLNPTVRARLYPLLGKNSLNVAQLAAYRYFGDSTTDWLPASLISPQTRDLITPFLYKRDGFMYFADLEAVRSEIRDPDELQRLSKGLLRQATMLVTLKVPDPSQISSIADYWGRGGRRTDIGPLLESIVGGGSDRSIDITHLLPPLAREHLYRYPKVTVADLDKPLLANCLWTSLNFFRANPDDRFLDKDVAIQYLKENYYLVQNKLQLGDIVVFTDAQGNIFHAAVYLADDLVFGKNGTTPLSPWTILPLERLKGYYVEHADEWHVTYHRRKDL